MITRDFIVSGIAAGIFVFYLLKEIVTSVYIFIMCPSGAVKLRLLSTFYQELNNVYFRL